MERSTNNSESIRIAARRVINRKLRMPPDWDEALLVTHNVQIEMAGLRGNNRSDETIKVEMDFRVTEEQRSDQTGLEVGLQFSMPDAIPGSRRNYIYSEVKPNQFAGHSSYWLQRDVPYLCPWWRAIPNTD